MLLNKLKQTIRPTHIDAEGVFKYIQILIEPKDKNAEETGSDKYMIVRGWKECGFHADILDKFQCEEMKDAELNLHYSSDCPGGGRINHDAEQKKIVIYGYSQGFGRCDHSLTQKYIQEEYPDYEVTWNNEGY